MSSSFGVPEPVSQYPAATSRSLVAWLTADAGDRRLDRPPTRLRRLATARSGDIAGGASMFCLGVSTLALGAFWSVLTGDAVPVLGWGVPALLLSAFGAATAHRARRRIPRARARVIRGPDTARGGILVASAIWGVVFLLSILLWPVAFERGAEGVLMMGAALVFVALVLVSGFVVPACILGRARTSLRAQVANDPAFRALLEQDRLTWRPATGDEPYGPL